MKYFVIFMIMLTGYSAISIENAFAEEEILILIENDARKLYYTGENIISAFFDPYTASIIFEIGENAYLDVKAPKIYKEGGSLLVLRNGEEVDGLKGSDECFYYITYHTKVPEKIEIVFAHWPEATELIENCETFTVPPPLKQFRNVNAANQVICKEGLQLLFKARDGSPACMKPQTAIKLIKDGWGLPNLLAKELFQNEPQCGTDFKIIYADATKHNQSLIIKSLADNLSAEHLGLHIPNSKLWWKYVEINDPDEKGISHLSVPGIIAEESLGGKVIVELLLRMHKDVLKAEYAVPWCN